MKQFLLIGCLVGGVLFSACGFRPLPYGGGGGPAPTKVAIQNFANDSFEPGIEFTFTDAIYREFLRRGDLRVVDDPAAADLVLTARIQPLRTRSRSFSSVKLALEYEVTVQLDLEVRRVDGSAVSLDPGMLQTSEFYLASADVEVLRKNRQEALRRMADILAMRIHDALYIQVAAPAP